MLRADSVRLSYGGRMILRDVALHVAPGEVVALLGRNGTGKSSLLRILQGGQPADHAYLEYDDRRLPAAFRSSGVVNLLAQAPFHPPQKRVAWLLRAYGIDAATFAARHTELANQLKVPFGQLNLGHRRLLEILMVLEAPTRYTLLDEPFAGLSPLAVDYVLGVIAGCSARKGILLSDQHYREALAAADRQYLLRDGHLHPFESEEELVELGYVPPPPLPSFTVEN